MNAFQTRFEMHATCIIIHMCTLTFVPYFHQFGERAVMPGVKREDSTKQMNLREFANTSAIERLLDVRIS